MMCKRWMRCAGAAGLLWLGVGEAAQSSPSPVKLPLGVSASLYSVSVPSGREPSPEAAALGEKLSNDKRLSSDNSVSCATCHIPEKGFTDHRTTSVGVKNQKGQRNSPTVLNAMFGANQFWDGRAASLEDQAKLPILNPIEMGQKSQEEVVAKIRTLPEYVQAFKAVYARDVTCDDLVSAIAAFERTQFSGNASFDRFIEGDEKALDASAQRSWSLFNGKARGTSCHAGNAIQPLFSDQKFHNIGIAAHQQDFVSLAREALVKVNAGDLGDVGAKVTPQDKKNPAHLGIY